MKISVSKVKNANEKLQEKITSYNENLGLYYNALRYTSNDWFDTKSRNYFDTINDDRLNELSFITEMRKISSIYNYVVFSYDDIGDEIYYNPVKKDQILELLASSKEMVSNILSAYNSMGISIYDERSILYNERSTLLLIRSNLARIESKIKNVIRRIETTEEATKQKLKDIEIKKVNTKDVSQFM